MGRFSGMEISIFIIKLKKNISSHPVTSKQPHKIVQIHMKRPVRPAGVFLRGLQLGILFEG